MGNIYTCSQGHSPAISAASWDALLIAIDLEQAGDFVRETGKPIVKKNQVVNGDFISICILFLVDLYNIKRKAISVLTYYYTYM